MKNDFPSVGAFGAHDRPPDTFRMLCIPIIAKTTQDACALMGSASRLADLLEIRVDHLKDPDLTRILAHRPRPLIITVAPRSEGGSFQGTEAERIALLHEAIALKADYIDINYACPERDSLLSARGRTKAIVSWHNFSETPADLEDIHARLNATGADIIKIATVAARMSDTMRMLQLIRGSRRKMIGICMGEQGEISRILAPLYGAFLTFASCEAGRESAPGQLPAQVMRNVYRIQDIRPGCRLYGLIGNPVSKSRGYLLFNALFRHHALNSLYLNILTDDVRDFFASGAHILSGFSVTMPHKESVMPFLDDIEPLAARIGAVNTVIVRDGRFLGCNTDAAGVLKPLQQVTSIRGKHVTLLGAGGAARAAAAGIVEAGGRLTILNRTPAKAADLAQQLGCDCGRLEDFDHMRTDILINMTPVGMHPRTHELPVSPDALRDMIVFEGIYTPARTRLVDEAARRGCRIIPGIEMFLHQAAEQFRLWTGIEPDVDRMRACVQ